MWAEILTQDDNSASCEHLMVLTLKEKREGSAELSVLTRTRLVKANPDIWVEEQRAGMAQKGTHFSLETLCLPWDTSQDMPSQQKVSHSSSETDCAAVQPLLLLTAGRKESEIYRGHLLTASLTGADTNWCSVSRPTVPTTTIPPLRAVKK